MWRQPDRLILSRTKANKNWAGGEGKIKSVKNCMLFYVLPYLF